MLQAYAMCMVLKRMGLIAEQICYDYSAVYCRVHQNVIESNKKKLINKVRYTIRKDGICGFAKKIIPYLKIGGF